MATGFQTPITIKDAIDNIDSHFYLLPAIQRKFVWSAEKVEILFDSIMRDYPINSFMFWHIKDNQIKKNFKFYEFLSEYREFFKVNNPGIETIGMKDFYAVIDGQQRLTSIYLGLKGTYAYKMPRKWWNDDEYALPTRKLYLNLDYQKSNTSADSYEYEFKFLTKQEVEAKKNSAEHWFKVRDILDMDSNMKVVKYITLHSLSERAMATLSTLYDRIYKDKLINYYLEEKQDIDSVLDIFIRTNSGGVPLSFSNLLMSITIANWKTEDGTDARKTLADLVQEVYKIGKPGFIISEDFILKTCLVLFKKDIRFNVKNFNAETVEEFGRNWERIKKSIVEVFRMLENWGFNDSSLRAKNAVIPLIYYVYHHNMEDSLNKKTWYIEDKNCMRKYLCIAILKGIFGGQTDNILTKIKNVLDANSTVGLFPLKAIAEEFKGNDRNFSFDDDYINSLLTTQKDHPACYSILALIYSHKDFETDKYHKDHLHPASAFTEKRLVEFFGSKESVPAIYRDSTCWNSIVNLQLLDAGLNESKNDQDLESWVKDRNINFSTQLIPENTSLKFSDFESFYNNRKALLIKRLKDATSIE